MHVYLHLFGLTIPSYGLLIASGVVIGNIIAFFVLKHEKLDRVQKAMERELQSITLEDVREDLKKYLEQENNK